MKAHTKKQPRPLLKRLLPLESLPRKIKLRVVRDFLSAESITSNVLNFKMEMPLKFPAITGALTLYQERELDHLFILKSVLKKGDHVLEIGANIGYYAVIEALEVGEAGHVSAYEPDPRNFEYLEKNIRLNGVEQRMSVHAGAISDQEGVLEFQVAESSNLSSMRRTKAKDEVNYADREYVGSIQVQVSKLSNVLSHASKPINVMRMDVEGHEVEVLASLAEFLEESGPDRAPRAIIFEPHSWEYTSEKGIEESLKTFVRHGYKFTYLGSRNEVSAPMHKLGWKPDRTFREVRGVTRGVYINPPQEEALRLAATVDGVTTICLER